MTNLFVDLVTPNGHRYRQPTGLFINNQFVHSYAGNTITSIHPATEQQIATVEAAGPEDVDRAVQAAQRALKHPSWKSMAPTDRGRLMARLTDLIEDRRELFATIDAWDNGKPFHVALSEDLPETIGTIRYYSGWADKIYGQTISTTPQKFAYTLRQPVAWKLGPALACGNTGVIKAAEQTPLSILLLTTLVQEAGFLPGVVNIINGYDQEAGVALIQHPFVDKVAFTGSTGTARQIMKGAATTLKGITLETGGKSPLVVFNDADLEQAVEWSHFGIMSNQGQICTATSRILVQQEIYDEFVTAFKESIPKLSIIGDQWDPTIFQGPQVTRAQYDRVLEHIDVGKAEGATLLAGGKPYNLRDGKGYFVEPTVFTDVSDIMKIYREDIFGPVVVITSLSTDEEAISRANDSTYGLGAAVFTRDVERAHQVAPDIEAGTVWVNSNQDSDFRVPFGGVKQSGIGRELGEAGLMAYTQIKAVHVNMGNRL